MDFIRKNPAISLLVVFVLGLVIGLVVLGWGLFPVQWAEATPDALSQTYQDYFVRAVADTYSYDNNTEKVQQALGGWASVDAACSLASRTTDPAEAQRLNAVAAVINGSGCAGVAVAPVTQTEPGTQAEPAAVPGQETDQSGGGNLAPVLFFGLLLAIIIGAIIYVLNRRKSLAAGGSSTQVMPDMAPVVGGDDGIETTPIASVDTTYSRGDDRFEYSFPIENESQDFLGDCGVAIAESLGSDTPKNVTAFEVWLFDKNDIRTRTKILMSEHAYHDEGIKAKLATKGTDQILAREGETIVLETVSLILNAIVTEIEYGDSANTPPESYFERLSIKFHVWRKEGDYAPDIEGRVEQIQRDNFESDDALDF